ncbi:MAG TPA: HD-GYP domain-containing protein [Acidobacteriaceae bacterium]|nr:HD-GYP domain-containing protein [Acidobacteriaceae bacterium]
MRTPIDRGLTAAPAYTPFGGYARLDRLIKSLDSADRRTALWAASLTATSIGGINALWLHGYRLPHLWAVVALGAIAAAAERQRVVVNDSSQMSVAFLPLVFSAVIFGPLGGFTVGALSTALDLPKAPFKWSVYTPVRGLETAAAGLVVAKLVPQPDHLGQYLLASLVGSMVFVGMDGFFQTATALVRGLDSVAYLKTFASLSWITVPLYVPVLTLFIYAYHTYSLELVLMFFAPTLALQRLLQLYREEKEATSRLATVNDRLRRASLSFATALVATLDARDQYTAGHSAAVAIYAKDIAQRMGLSDEQQELVHLCGLVHDIGKIGLPAGLLEKPGPLTLEERRQMEQHSEIGERILRNVDDYSEIADIVRSHHERIDGMGYPDGISADDIPLLARIISVADAYDAMTSNRPYREALPSRVARMRLAQAVGTQFDTGVVAAFEAILATADENYRSGRGYSFMREREQLERDGEGVAVALDVVT